MYSVLPVIYVRLADMQARLADCADTDLCLVERREPKPAAKEGWRSESGYKDMTWGKTPSWRRRPPGSNEHFGYKAWVPEDEPTSFIPPPLTS